MYPNARCQFWAVLALAIFPSLISGCGGTPDEASQDVGSSRENGRPTVVVINPKRVDVNSTLTLAGNLEPYERAALFAKVTGFLESVHVDIGDTVSKGDVLAELTVPEMLSDLRRAEANLAKAKANRRLAGVTHERLANLRAAEPGAATEQDVDLAAAKLEVARADVQLAEAKITGLRTMMSYSMIRAPFDGVVTRRFTDTGALIVAGATNSEPIVEVVRTDRLRLTFAVPEVISPFVEPGQTVRFTLDVFPGKSFEKPITRCARTLMTSTRSMRAEIDLDGADGKFWPGMYATVHIAYRHIPQALVIPATTLRVDEGDSGVYAVENGVIRRIPVTLLVDDGIELVVRGDLSPQTDVVIAGPAYLGQGQKVHLERRGAAG